MEQLVLLLIIAGISLINWLVEKSNKLREQKRLEAEREQQPQQTAFPVEVTPTSMPRTEEVVQPSDQMRHLLEMMGIPTEFPQEPVEAEPVSEGKPVSTALNEPPALPAPTRPSLRKKRPLALPTGRSTTPWRQRLHSNKALREAIVLREILGPPRALS